MAGLSVHPAASDTQCYSRCYTSVRIWLVAALGYYYYHVLCTTLRTLVLLLRVTIHHTCYDRGSILSPSSELTELLN